MAAEVGSGACRGNFTRERASLYAGALSVHEKSRKHGRELEPHGCLVADLAAQRT